MLSISRFTAFGNISTKASCSNCSALQFRFWQLFLRTTYSAISAVISLTTTIRRVHLCFLACVFRAYSIYRLTMARHLHCWIIFAISGVFGFYLSPSLLRIMVALIVGAPTVSAQLRCSPFLLRIILALITEDSSRLHGWHSPASSSLPAFITEDIARSQC